MTQTISHILIVDDDRQIASNIQHYLDAYGFQCESACTAADFMRKLKHSNPVMCIVDLGLPDIDGMDLVREIKANSSAGVLILTGRSHVSDKVMGLEIGADDYMVKPFDPRELVARVKSVIRRQSESPQVKTKAEVASFHQWKFNLANNTLSSDHQTEIVLSTAEAELLKVFVKNSNRILPRERLVGHRDMGPNDRSVDIRISRLRKKLETDAKSQEIIKTVYGSGYLFLAQVTWDTLENNPS
ncbi:MAG: response regulator transcription factor [Fluviibacter sp.]